MLRVVAVAFGIVGLLSLAVFAVGAQELTRELGPYPSPEAGGVSLMISSMRVHSSRELTGTLPIIVLIEGQRLYADGNVVRQRAYNNGWIIDMEVLPRGMPRMK